MNNIKLLFKCLAGLLALSGVVLLASCESSTDDIVGVRVVNQTGAPLSLYVDGGDTPELTVAPNSTSLLVSGAGTRQIQWRGGAIQGQVDVSIAQNETKTLTIWGSGNACSVK